MPKPHQTPARLDGCAGAFSYPAAPLGSCTRCGWPGLACYTLPPVLPVVRPVRPAGRLSLCGWYSYTPTACGGSCGRFWRSGGYTGIKEPRQAVNLSGAVGVISISSGASGASSSQASFSRWRGLALGYCTRSSRPGSCSTLYRIGAAVRTPSHLKCFGCPGLTVCGAPPVHQN